MLESESLEPLSLRETRSLLATLGATPSKHLGQNFLIDKNIVWKSVALAEVQEGDNVIEIGPGLGTLTRALLAKGCHVFAVEFDRQLYAFLSNFASSIEALSHNGGIRGRLSIVHGDAVQFPLAGFSRFEETFKVVANLPYNISTPWIDALLSQANESFFGTSHLAQGTLVDEEIHQSGIYSAKSAKMSVDTLASQLPTSLTLMLQKEAAQRFTAPPKTKAYSEISIRLSAAYECRQVVPVARTSFMPAPNVDSVILHLVRKDNPRFFSRKMQSLMRDVFTQRRKQMLSVLKKKFPLTVDYFIEQLKAYEFSETVRPEQLPLAFWLAFDETLPEE